MDLTKLPITDLHFWVERNGEIIDPHFPNYDWVASFRRVENTKNYHAAPEDVQEHFIKLYRPIWQEVKIQLTLVGGKYNKMHNFCQFNSFQEIEENGGKVVCGSMGFGEGDKIFWEFGNPDWKTVKNFMKRV